jgi:hypothetical protein
MDFVPGTLSGHTGHVTLGREHSMLSDVHPQWFKVGIIGGAGLDFLLVTQVHRLPQA